MKRFLLTVPLLLAVACGRDSATSAPKDANEQQVYRSVPAAAPATLAAAAIRREDAGPEQPLRIGIPERMLIRSGELTIRVDSIDRGLARLNEVAAAIGAIVSGSSVQGGDGQHRSASAELRIRAADFDRALVGLRRLGVVETEAVTTQDVGEDYVDVTARIANGRRLEARLISLVATRAAKLADVVAVEQELSRVRGEIESLEGRRRYLESHASLSTLTINLHEPTTVVGVPGPGVMRQAFEQSWDNFVWLVALLVRSAGVVVPLGLAVAVLWSVSRRRNSPVAVR